MKKRNFYLKISAVIMTIMLIAAMALCMTSCGKDGITTDTSSITETANAEAITIGEGKTSFNFTVTYADGKVDKFIVNTDADNVGDALLNAGIISGSDSEYGLMVDSVNGVKADYSVDKAYWAFYINGKYATTGVSATAVTADAEYAFVYTKG